MKQAAELVEHIRQHAPELSKTIPELKNKKAKIHFLGFDRDVCGPTLEDLVAELQEKDENGLVEVEMFYKTRVRIGQNIYIIGINTTAFYWVTLTNCAGDYHTPGTSSADTSFDCETFANIVEDETR
jgi:hypothetical protein